MKRGDRICIKALVMDTPDKGVVEARTKHGTKIYVHPKDAELLDKVMIDLDPAVQKWAATHPKDVQSWIQRGYYDNVLLRAELGLEEEKDGKQSEINDQCEA